MSLSTSIIVGGHAEQAIEALQNTANTVRETARIAGASAREQYEAYQLAIRGIKEEQEASETAFRSKVASSARIQAAWQREKLAQDQAIDAQQASARAQEMSALKADILARSNQQAAATANAYADTLRSLGVAAKEAAESQEMLGKSAEHGANKMAYASASVRLFESGVGGSIRAVERFLSETLGLAPILEAAFPVVGAIALVGILTEMAKKAYDAYQNIFNLKSAIEGLDQAEITVTQRVKQEQDRSEQYKEDSVRDTQGPEAAARLHQQYQSAQGVDLSSYFYDKRFSGLKDNVKANYETQYKNVSAGDIPQKLSDINKEVHDLQGALYTINNSGGMAVPKKINGYGPEGQNPEAYYQARLKAAKQIQDQLEAQAGSRSAGLQAGEGAIVKAHKDEAKKAQEKADEAARKAQAAQRKADEDHLHALEGQFELQKLQRQTWETTTNFEQRQRLAQSNFYLGHLGDFKTDDVRKQAFDLGHKPLDEYNNTDTEGQAAFKKMMSGIGSSEDIFSGLGSDKDTQARLKAQQEAKSAQDELNNKLRQTAVAQDLQSGAISKYDAAVQMAALHTEAYQLQLEKLQAEAKQIANDPTLNEEQRRTKLIGIGAQIGDLGQNRDAQRSIDNTNIHDQTASGGWNNSLNQFVQQSRDTASQVANIWTDALSSVNEELVKIVSTKHNYGLRREFGNLGAGMFRGVAAAGLQKGEGALMGALGLGTKADGSQSKPFHVIMAGASGAASAAGGALSKAAGGIGGFFGKIAPMLSGLGFADGGMPPVGMASLVGENGPELFVPHTAGTVIPNGAFGGSSITHHINVDARNATDPAQVNALVQRGIMKALPAITNASMQAQRDHNSRKPASARH